MSSTTLGEALGIKRNQTIWIIQQNIRFRPKSHPKFFFSAEVSATSKACMRKFQIPAGIPVSFFIWFRPEPESSMKILVLV